jgi:hypothetical protein
MLARIRWLVLPVLAVCAFGASGIRASFRGVVVKPTIASRSDDGWVYVQGRNQLLRRVHVAGANIIYSPSVSASERKQHSASALAAGADVRVTAKQDGRGEWQALTIEVLGYHHPEPALPDQTPAEAIPTLKAEREK